MGFVVTQLSGSTPDTGIVPVQYTPVRPTVEPAAPLAEAPRPPGSLTAGALPASCTLREPDASVAGIAGAQACARDLRRTGTTRGMLVETYRRELAGLDALIARATRGDAAAHAELVTVYNRHYALMAPTTPGYEADAERQRDYTARLERYVGALMDSDLRQYPSGQDSEIAINRAARDILARRAPSKSATDVNRLAWVAGSGRDLVRSLTRDPALVPWLAALHADPRFQTPAVRDAWQDLPLEIATASSFNQAYRDTRAALPSAERAAFTRAVIAELERLRGEAALPENRERYPNTLADLQARLAYVATVR